jgi:hypothetical protein
MARGAIAQVEAIGRAQISEMNAIAPEAGSQRTEVSEELTETRGLVRMVHMFLENYRQITNNTRTDQVVRRASRRVEEALIECMRKATDELARAQPGSFECHFCGAKHDLARDLEVLQRDGIGTVFLQRAFRYDYRHAVEVVRQLVERGFVSFVGEQFCQGGGMGERPPLQEEAAK